MRASLPFPKSFPNEQEWCFLNLLLCDSPYFPKLFADWEQKIVLDEIEYATSRLLPLLSRRLREFPTIQSNIVPRIHGVHKLAWVKNQRLLEAINQVVPLLEQEGISVLLLKGIPLLLTVYNDIGARFLGDADLLISPRHLKKALHLLLDAGWKLASPRFPKHEYFSEEQLARITKEMTFVNAQGLEIDIHWRLFEVEEGKEHASFETLWERSVAIHFKERAYRTLSPEDLLIHVIAHGAEGNSHRPLRWVVDATKIIQILPIDWTLLLKTIKQSAWTVELYLACSFLQQHQCVAFPDFFIDELLTIPLSKTDVRRYYQKANTPHAWWGSFPRLWNAYWKHETRRRGLSELVSFRVYLAHAWGFERSPELIPFILNKYRERICHLLR